MEQNNDALELVHSIEEAENIAKLMIIQGDIDGLYGLRNIILTGSIRGSSDEFHNFCVNYARRGDYDSACELLEVGLQQHPYSTDLLADYIQYGVKCGKWENAKTYYERLMGIPMERWTWRSFDFSIDYLKATVSSQTNPQDFEEEKDNMLSLANAFHQYLPFDEQPYLAKAEVFEFYGDMVNFETTLKDAIHGIRVAPKCCLKYSELMLERGEYEEVITTAKKGIIASAQDQASINIGYLFYISALAKDALIHENDDYSNESAILDVYSDYAIAETLLDRGKVAYRNTISTRTFILEVKSGIHYHSYEGANEEIEN